ncbi:MAG: hypothetical protein H6624_11535 [Bdellovibrionaceae bacterium]|nr:hypothetical protein [Bdellovibrionales bacterium]MCB9084971.1 hypothetical protein [Pseudobdellovibrionaceae bacterium]
MAAKFRFKFRFKRLGLILVLVPTIILLGILLLEGFLSIQSYQQWKSWDREIHIVERNELLGTLTNLFTVGTDKKAWESRLKLHPLFGYVYRQGEGEVNRFGFQTRYDFRSCESGYCVPGADGEQGRPFVVGIFGGSLAHMVGEQADKLEQLIGGWLKGRTVRVINLAAGGHNSTISQQVFSYFREAFDAVVFVDGIHEIWSGQENNKAGWLPDGVRLSHFEHLIRTADWGEEEIQKAHEIIEKRQALADLTRSTLKGFWKHSLLVHRIWGILGAQLMRDLVRLKGELPKAEGGEAFFAGSDRELFKWLAQRWALVHGDISAVAESLGIIDLHYLQPNPHVPNSKALTSREDHILKYSFPIRELVIQAYNEFQTAAKQSSKRVTIHDLSKLYHGEGEEIWRDGLHPNDRGLEILLERISSDLKSSLLKPAKAKARWR